jgi:hypothetical protein
MLLRKVAGKGLEVEQETEALKVARKDLEGWRLWIKRLKR